MKNYVSIFFLLIVSGSSFKLSNIVVCMMNEAVSGILHLVEMNIKKWFCKDSKVVMDRQ